MSKRVWERPQLIVLVRSTSGESVLRVCKTARSGFRSPVGLGGQDCMARGGRQCGACQSLGGGSS